MHKRSKLENSLTAFYCLRFTCTLKLDYPNAFHMARLNEPLLTVSSHVDSSRRDVNIHEIVDDPALYVTLVLVDENLLSGVKDLDEAVIVLFLFINRLVHCLVMTDPFPEIRHDFVNVAERDVIRTGTNNIKLILHK